MAKSLRCQFDIEACLKDAVIIRDIGHLRSKMTVTNDAEAVVEHLQRVLSRYPRLLYYDSMDQLGEILVENGRFAGFRHLSQVEIAELLATKRD